MPPLHVAVIGAGAFGRNHLRVYSELAAATLTPHADALTLLGFVDPDPAVRETLAARFETRAFATVDDLLASGLPLDAASVCVPTRAHAAIATQLLHRGVDVLIEKPLAASLDEADALLALAARLGRTLAVGHLERFNPAVTALLDRLTQPMFFEAHRLSIFTPRSLDVDVVLDLMIHDLDIVLALARSPVREVRAVGLPVLSSKTDIANVRLEFDSGCVANFTASRVSTEQVRKLRLFQPREYLSVDFARQELLTVAVAPALAAAMKTHAAAPDPAGHLARHLSAPGPSLPPSGDPHPSPGLQLEKLELPRAEPLRLELENFLAALRGHTVLRVPGTAGRAALALALEINDQMAAHAHRAGLA